MNELKYLVETNSLRNPHFLVVFFERVASDLRNVVSFFAELVLGIIGVLIFQLPKPFVRCRTLLFAFMMTWYCGESRPLHDLEELARTATPVSLESIIEEYKTANSTAISLHHDIYRRSLERWANPCELPGFIFDESYLEGVPRADELETARRILQSTRSARGPAQKLLDNYGVRIFHDPHYINYSIMRLKWLPLIDRNELIDMNLKRAIKYFGDKLPFFGIALTQVTVDQVLHSGPFVEETREVETILTQDVCQIQLGGLSLGIRPSKTVISEAMDKEYKDTRSKSQRELRDILILRDYNEFLKVMEQTFKLIIEKQRFENPPSTQIPPGWLQSTK